MSRRASSGSLNIGPISGTGAVAALNNDYTTSVVKDNHFSTDDHDIQNRDSADNTISSMLSLTDIKNPSDINTSTYNLIYSNPPLESIRLLEKMRYKVGMKLIDKYMLYGGNVEHHSPG